MFAQGKYKQGQNEETKKNMSLAIIAESLRRYSAIFAILLFLKVFFLFIIAVALANRYGLGCCGSSNRGFIGGRGFGRNGGNGADVVVINDIDQPNVIANTGIIDGF